MTDDLESYIPLSQVMPEELWPSDLFSSPDGTNFLDKFAVISYDERETENGISIYLRTKVMSEIKFDLPFIDGISLILGKGDSQNSGLIDMDASIEFRDSDPPILEFNIDTTVLSLRINRSLLQPVEVRNTNGKTTFVKKDEDINIPLPFGLSLKYDTDWNFDFDLPSGTNLSLPQCTIGESGVVAEAQTISLCFSADSMNNLPSSIPREWRGLYLDGVKIYLPEDIDVPLPNVIQLDNFFIGSGGFCGKITGSSNPSPQIKQDNSGFDGECTGEIFGVPFGLKSISLEFKQNTFVDSSIQGSILLPFFDGPVDVDIALTTNGDFTIGLLSHSGSGLAKLTKADLLELSLENIGFGVKNKIFSVTVGGKLKPLFGSPALKWPEFDVKALTIDSKGNVKIEGGWIEIPKQLSMDFHGFNLDLSKIGFGKEEDGSKWIGLSGGITIVDGIPLKGGVDGLKIIWHSNNKFSLEISGINVAFEIKDVLKFAGKVFFIDTPTNKGFKGGMDMTLYPLNGMNLDVQFMAGRNSQSPAYNYFYIYLGVELPVGIPLGTTPVSLYGIAGLFGYNATLDKKDNEAWVENDDGTPGFYKRTPVGITDAQKWTDARDSLAFGAGITLGTTDNGFTISAKALLALLIPGPIILVEGKASFLKNRAGLNDDPIFRMLAVFDNKAGTFLLNIDARYKVPSDGKVLDINGSAEAFFNFNNPSDWHLYLGKNDPTSKRIRAGILSLFEANAYFMIDNNGVLTGAHIGFDKKWSFGPLGVSLDAWIEGMLALSRKPIQALGSLEIYGDVKLKAFGVGIGLTIDALLAAKTPNPWFLNAHFSVKMKLPWPLPSPKASIALKWEEEKAPPWPLPLASIGIEHPMVSEKWTLQKDVSYADSDGFVQNFSPQGNAPNLADTPVIPLDARPAIIFARSVSDESPLPWANSQPVSPETVGEYTYNYSLNSISLEEQEKSGGGWSTVAAKGTGTGSASELNGMWQWSQDGSTPNNTKLMLWANTPFENTRELDTNYPILGAMFAYNKKCYLCNMDTTEKLVCVDFDGIPDGDSFYPYLVQDNFIFYAKCPIKIVSYDAIWADTKHALQVDCGTDEQTKGNDKTGTDKSGHDCIDFSTIKENELEKILKENGIKPNRSYELIPGYNGQRGLDAGNGFIIALPCISSYVKIVLSTKSGKNDFAFVCIITENSTVQQKISISGIIEPLEFRSPNIKEIIISANADIIVYEICYACNESHDKTKLDDGKITVTTSSVTNIITPGGTNIITSIEPSSVIPTDTTTIPRMGISPNPPPMPTFKTIMPHQVESRRGISKTLSVDELGRNSLLTTLMKKTVTKYPKTSPLLVVLPDEMAKVKIIFSKDSNGIIKMYDKDYHDLGSTSFNIPSTASDNKTTFELKQLPQKINAFEISGHFLLLKVCGLSEEEMHRVERNEFLQSQQKDKLVENWAKQYADILKPNKYYKLTVVTRATRTDGDGYAESYTFTESSYFQTKNPPGAYLPTDAAKVVPPEDAKIPSGDMEHYPYRGPLRDLSPYVEFTIPPQVASNEPQNPVYRSYDIGIQFNKSYVSQMYKMASLPLRIRLFDNNNNEIRDANGDILSLKNNWSDNGKETLTREQKQWKEILKNSDCNFNLSSEPLPDKNQSLNVGSIELALDPQTFYKAKLYADQYPIYPFSFVTSRYCTFTHHLHSFVDAVWDYDVLSGHPTHPLVNGATLDTTIVPSTPKLESDIFEDLIKLFKLDNRQLPKQLEMMVLNDSTPKYYGLLLESPEPIDWSRINLIVKQNSGNTQLEECSSIVKIIKANSDSGSTEPNEEWVDILLKESINPSDIIIEHKHLSDTSPNFAEYFTFHDEQILPAGAIIRIHSGNKKYDTTTGALVLDVDDPKEYYHRYQDDSALAPTSSAFNFRSTSGSTEDEVVRITDKNGKILHKRVMLLRSDAYSSKDYVLIRNKDQTSAFIFLKSSTDNYGGLVDGRYKFEFTFKRDTGDGKPILKRNNSSDSEEAVIEFNLPPSLPGV